MDLTLSVILRGEMFKINVAAQYYTSKPKNTNNNNPNKTKISRKSNAVYSCMV